MATSVVTQMNNHPFIFGRYSFMHNGMIAHFEKVRRPMCDLMSSESYELIKGTTDSEHLAALFFTHLAALASKQPTNDPPSAPHTPPTTSTVDPHQRTAHATTATHPSPTFTTSHPLPLLKLALERTISTVVALQAQHLPLDLYATRFSSLNLAVTDGYKFICTRFITNPNPDVEPASLYLSETAGVTLNRQFPGHPDGKSGVYGGRWGRKAREGELRHPDEHKSHLIVASEPTTYDAKEWKLIKKNTCVMVDMVDDTWDIQKDVPMDVQLEP
jgi:glutamine amidotransferase